jgi:hypothetical protein
MRHDEPVTVEEVARMLGVPFPIDHRSRKVVKAADTLDGQSLPKVDGTDDTAAIVEQIEELLLSLPADQRTEVLQQLGASSAEVDDVTNSLTFKAATAIEQRYTDEADEDKRQRLRQRMQQGAPDADVNQLYGLIKAMVKKLGLNTGKLVRLLTSNMNEDDHAEEADRAIERLRTTKSKAKPGSSFNALVSDTVRQWNDPNGFTNSLRPEPFVTVFSPQRLREEAAEVAKHDPGSPTSSIWHREPRRSKGPRITEVPER